MVRSRNLPMRLPLITIGYTGLGDRLGNGVLSRTVPRVLSLKKASNMARTNVITSHIKRGVSSRCLA